MCNWAWLNAVNTILDWTQSNCRFPIQHSTNKGGGGGLCSLVKPHFFVALPFLGPPSLYSSYQTGNYKCSRIFIINVFFLNIIFNKKCINLFIYIWYSNNQRVPFDCCMGNSSWMKDIIQNHFVGIVANRSHVWRVW